MLSKLQFQISQNHQKYFFLTKRIKIKVNIYFYKIETAIFRRNKCKPCSLGSFTDFASGFKPKRSLEMTVNEDNAKSYHSMFVIQVKILKYPKYICC